MNEVDKETMTRNMGVQRPLIGVLCVLLAFFYAVPCIEGSAAVHSAAAQEQLIVSVLPRAQTVHKGETFTVDIYMDPKDQGVSGGELDISFDSGVATVVDIAPGDLLGDDALEGVRTVDNDRGKILFALGRQGETHVPTAPGVFATITFIADDTMAGSFSLDFGDSSFCDERFDDITQMITNSARVCVASEEVIRDVPAQVVRGTSFDIAITFSAPQDGFNAIGLSDVTAVDYLSIKVQSDRCEPNADYGKVKENKTEYMWLGPYVAGTPFTARYRVDVPDDAPLGPCSFDGWLEYYIGSDGPYTKGIGGDLQVVMKETMEPQLGVVPSSLTHDFGSIASGQIETWNFEIVNRGLGILEWGIEDDQPWIEVNPARGETTVEIDTTTITIDTTGLAGIHTGTMTVTSNGGTEMASIIVEVEMDGVLKPAEEMAEYAVSIAPSMPLTTDDLVCSITGGNTDLNQDEIEYVFQWYKNGELQSDMVTNYVLANNTNTGDVWECIILPGEGSVDDKYAEDEVIVFAVVVVLNDEVPPEIDATAKADTEVYFTGTGAVTGSVGIVKYRQKPVFPTVTLPIAPGKEPLKFIDVQASGFTEGTAEVKVHYTDDEVSTLVEESLGLFYWEGDGWQPVPSAMVDTNENSVSGELPVSGLAGLPIAVGGDPRADAGEEATSDIDWILIIAVIMGAGVVAYLVFRVVRGKNHVTG